jgi:hypothetical protein
MADDIVIVAKYLYPTEAEMAKIRLESEGIECLIANQMTAQLTTAMGSMGGILVQVRAQDAERALAIISADMPAPRVGMALPESWQITDEMELDIEPKTAFQLVQDAWSKIGRVSKSDPDSLTVDGTAKYWLNKVTMRVEIQAENDVSRLYVCARGQDIRAVAADKCLERLKEAIIELRQEKSEA